MPRALASALLALALPVGVLSAVPIATAAAPAATTDQRTHHRSDDPRATAADRALERARGVLSGRTRSSRAPSATLALAELFAERPALSSSEQAQADRLLARPTDGADDPLLDGYTRTSRKVCGGSVCVHWVPTGADAPPSRAWVDTTLQVMRQVWRTEVTTLDYGRPPEDGTRGGSGQYDVYLKDIGARGLYGYCSPEQRRRGRTATSYIVLDNDFAREQFGQTPLTSLKATAAHEFFHAIQFDHDYGDDGWFMEATATWMEERVFDAVNDNRQYLPSGQLGSPGRALDRYVNGGAAQYGNWAFFEYLSQRFGNGIVRAAWRRAAHYDGAPKLYSTQAVLRSLPASRSWASVFRAYAAANTIPATDYAEGGAWPAAPMRSRHTLTSGEPTAADTLALNHLAAQHVALSPGSGVERNHWRVRVTVNGPGSRTTPAAYLLVHRTGGDVERRAIPLDRTGAGSATVGFGSAQVTEVTLTLANASTRFDCNRGTESSCHGVSRDDGREFGYRVRAFRS